MNNSPVWINEEASHEPVLVESGRAGMVARVGPPGGRGAPRTIERLRRTGYRREPVCEAHTLCQPVSRDGWVCETCGIEFVMRADAKTGAVRVVMR